MAEIRMTERTNAERRMIEALRVLNTPDEPWIESSTEWFRKLPRVANRRRAVAALTEIELTAAEHDLLDAARCWPASLTVAIADALTNKVVEAAEDQEDAP